MDKIPTSIIGLLSQIFPLPYTQANIDALFLFAGAPEPIPDGSKATKVQAWLRQINKLSDEPLKVLGAILDDFMEKPLPTNTFWQSSSDDHAKKLEEQKDKVRETLAREGLTYIRGGNIVKAGATSTRTLEESVKKHGLASVDVEIQRALAQIEQDPNAAAQYAANVLEAVLKAYLGHKGKSYGSNDHLAELWKLSAEQIGLRPVDWDNKDLKKIASGRRCCTTLTFEDSQSESMRLDGPHEQADLRPLPHDELVHLHCSASQAGLIADLAGQGDDLARAA